jgi:transcriptional regulator with XRE-family HTH domain
LRLKQHLSRQQVQDRTGIHRNSLERYERGCDIPIMTFVRICVALGSSCAAVLDRVMPGDGRRAPRPELVKPKP